MSVTSIDDHRRRNQPPEPWEPWEPLPPGPDVPRDLPSDGDPRRRFLIDVMDTDLPRMSGKAWKAIEAANDPPQYFAVGTTPARIIGGHDDAPVTVQELGVDSMRGISGRTAYWFKQKAEGIVPQFPVETAIRDMLACSRPPLPPLKRITHAPTFGADGSLSVQPGYNPATGNYYAASGLVVTAPSLRPSRVEIAAALALLLDEFLGDFPFAGPADRAHAVVLMLNGFVRDLIDGPTPLQMIEAPAAGTGKGLLATMAMMPLLGGSPVMMPPVQNDEEARKSLSATLFGLPETILIDNIPDGLNSPHLASALTSADWSGRVLGKSIDRTVPIRATWMATGNNPTLSTEMERRVIRIRLDSKTERPEERASFRHRHLERWARQHRGELVSACLTLVQAWIAAGRPSSDHVLGSYDAWTEVHGGILSVIGLPGFLANRDEGRSARVSEDDIWASFVAAWWTEFAGNVVTATDLFPLARHLPDFPLGRATDERGQRTFFGMGLKRNRDRIFDGHQITYAGRRNNAASYRLVPTGEVPF